MKHMETRDTRNHDSKQIEWTLDFENHPQEACETMVMLNIVLPGLPPDALAYDMGVSIADIPEIINRYEYSYHPKPRHK